MRGDGAGDAWPPRLLARGVRLRQPGAGTAATARILTQPPIQLPLALTGTYNFARSYSRWYTTKLLIADDCGFSIQIIENTGGDP